MAAVSGFGRVRWAAIGAALAVSLVAGGIGIVNATISSGPKAVYVPISPCRLADTRPGTDNVGLKNTPIGPGQTHTFTVRGSNGNCVIPVGATAIVANVTAVAPTAQSFMAIWPADKPQPTASSLNYSAGQAPFPNAVTVTLSGDGKIKAFNKNGNVHVIIDIAGYYEDHNHDDRYLQKYQPIVINESGSNWHTSPLVSVAPTQFQPTGPTVFSSADGAVWISLTSPPAVGGASYVLSSVEYCVLQIQTGARVDQVILVGDTGILTASVAASDTTHRTTPGCYTLQPAEGGGARAYAFVAGLTRSSGAPTPLDVLLSSVRSTWVPLANGAAPSATPDEVPAPPVDFLEPGSLFSVTLEP
jgi:hypothetical protein